MRRRRSVPSSTRTRYAGGAVAADHTTVSIAPSKLVERAAAVAVSSVVLAAGPVAVAPSATTEIVGFAAAGVNGKVIDVSEVVSVVLPTVTL